MVQEFHVVKCFSCQTFQVHQVKKSKKWICKMCGEKQSLIKEFGRGSGADCRRHVQKLNGMQGEKMMEAEQTASLLWEETTTSTEHVTQKGGEGDVVTPQQMDTKVDSQVSRWSKYLHQPEAGHSLEAESEDEKEENIYLDRDCFHVNKKGSNRKRKRRGACGDEGNYYSREEHNNLNHDVDRDSKPTCHPETSTNSWRRSAQAQERGTVFSSLKNSSKRPACTTHISTANSTSLPNPSRLNTATSYPDRHSATAISSPPPGSNTVSRWNQYLSTPHVLEEEDDDGFWVPEAVAEHQSVGTRSAGDPACRGAASVGGLGSVRFNKMKTTASPCGMGEASSKPAHITRPACSISVAPPIKGLHLSLPIDSLFSTGDDFDDGF